MEHNNKNSFTNEKNTKHEIKSKYFKIKNFRNICLKNENDKFEKLFLNANLDNFKIGDLIILLSNNNVGKTNVLDALKIYGKANSFNWEVNKPNYIEGYELYDNGYLSVDFYNNSTLQKVYKFTDDNKRLYNDKESIFISPIEIKNIIKSYIAYINNRGFYTSEFENSCLSYITDNSLVEIITPEIHLQLVYEYLTNNGTFDMDYRALNQFQKSLFYVLVNNYTYLLTHYYYQTPEYTDFKLVLSNSKPLVGVNNYNVRTLVEIKEIPSNDKITLETSPDELCKIVNDDNLDQIRIGWPIIEQLDFETYEDSDFSCNYEKLDDSKLVKKIIAFSGFKTSEIVNIVEKSKNGYSSLRDSLEEKINDRLKSFMKGFNSLINDFGSATEEYTIKVKLDRNYIEICLKSKKQPLQFSSQSESFKWLFSFFIWTKWAAKQDISNSIYLFEDTFCSNLQPNVIKNVRTMLKELAYKSNALFIIGTHNPYFVDPNHFEEVRLLIKDDDSKVSIDNSFYPISTNPEHASVSSLLKAFTSANLIWKRSKKTQVVFVEDLNNYCYITAFYEYFTRNSNNKQIDNKELIFIPITNLESAKEIVSKCYSFTDNLNFLLNGGSDSKKISSAIMKENDAKNINVFMTNDINSECHTLADLIVSSDKQYIQNNTFENAISFKKALISGLIKPNEKTLENFKNLFLCFQ